MSQPVSSALLPAPVLYASGEMADRIRSFNWASTTLGAIETWSATLASHVNLLLCLPQPAILIWGDDLCLLYNDAAITTLGTGHPGALGQSYADVFADAWPLIEADVEACRLHGQIHTSENVAIPLRRGDEVITYFFTYFLVPIYENGRIAGIQNLFLDVTQSRADRIAKQESDDSQRLLLRLTDAQRSATDGRTIMQLCTELVGQHLDVGRAGYAEVLPDLSGMTFQTGWVQGGMKLLTGSVPLAYWSEMTSSDFLRGRTVVYNDVRTELGIAAVTAHYEEVGAIAVLAVPFLRRGIWRGSLYLNHPVPRVWTAHEIALVEEMARRTAEAVERAQAEEEVRELAGRLGMAQQAGQMASWEWDFASNLLTWDGGSEWTYGRPPSVMTGIDQVFSYVCEDDREAVRRALIPAIEGTGEYRCEFRVKWPDGSVHWILAFGRTTWSFDGKPSGIIGININITDQKHAATTLLQTEKLAAVGRLASTMAHEINNPLEAVTNLLYLARHSSDLAEAQPFLDTADAELRRAAAITNQALRFHKQATRPTLCTFQQLTKDLFQGRHSRLRNSRASEEERDRTSHPVLCFEGEVRQVLNNLVGNAIDALGGIGGKLYLRGRDGIDWRTGKPGMVLTLADTGSGMSKATQARLFDAFFTTKGIGGTGLGLWVSQEIIERHAGRIRMRSSQKPEHHGTVFTIFLPYDAAKREPAGATA